MTYSWNKWWVDQTPIKIGHFWGDMKPKICQEILSLESLIRNEFVTTDLKKQRNVPSEEHFCANTLEKIIGYVH